MTVTVCQVGSLDLLTAPYTLQSADLPDARLTDLGRAAQLAGALPHRSHYDEAPFSLVVTVSGASVSDSVEALVREVRAGATLRFSESAEMLSTRLLSVDAASTEVYGAWTRVSFTGARAPEWEGASVDLGTLTVTGGWGTVDAPVVGGEIAAKCRLYATVAGTASSLHIGVRPDPAADYAPLDDYSGVSDATAIGGAWGAAANLSGTAAALGTAPSVDVAANRGSHLCVARLKNSATAAASVRYSVGSAILGAEVVQPSVAATGTSTAAVEVLGTVEVPSAPVPSGTASYSTSATDITQTAHDTTNAGETAPYYPVYVFDVDGDSLHTITLSGGPVETPTGGTIRIYRTDGTQIGEIARTIVFSEFTHLNPTTWTVDIPTTSGEKLAAVLIGHSPSDPLPFRYKASEVHSEGGFYKVNGANPTEGTLLEASTLVGDMYLVTTVRNRVALSATNTVRATCSESSKTGSLDAMLRVPTDFSALSVVSAFTANTGVMYDPDTRSLYPCDNSPALTGTALRPSLLSGIHLAPGVTNRFVVAAGAKTDVTLQGTATECYIRRR